MGSLAKGKNMQAEVIDESQRQTMDLPEQVSTTTRPKRKKIEDEPVIKEIFTLLQDYKVDLDKFQKFMDLQLANPIPAPIQQSQEVIVSKGPELTGEEIKEEIVKYIIKHNVKSFNVGTKLFRTTQIEKIAFIMKDIFEIKRK